MAAASRRTIPGNSVTVFIVCPRRGRYAAPALLRFLGRFELLEIIVRSLGQLVVVQVFVATIAGELLSPDLGLLDHVLHHLLRFGPPALRAGAGRRGVAFGRDRALAFVGGTGGS